MTSTLQMSESSTSAVQAKPKRLNYYRRIFSAYLRPGTSQLTFWHEVPEVNEQLSTDHLGEYYMLFKSKADYPGPFDDDGIPLLDYHGTIGRQYNPIAIAQYGLGNYNLYARTGDTDRKNKFLKVADWLVSSLAQNAAGLQVWMHNFDWEYRDRLCAPWYSGLAQGQGISVLLRAHQITANSAYLEAARNAFRSFNVDVKQGGVSCYDERGNLWLEEYIVSPPTHILNGFMWTIWGVYDYFLATGDADARKLFDDSVQTLRHSLQDFDTGFWSLYEQSATKLKMIASPFYHSLHIVELRIMEKLTGEGIFGLFADRWQSYRSSWLKRMWAFLYKVVFKLCYY